MPTMIRTGLTHGICKPDNLPLDTAYEITGTGNDMDYYCSCITTENVIHVFIYDRSIAMPSLWHYYSDNDGHDWDREEIYVPANQINFAGCDVLPSSNDIYLAILESDGGGGLNIKWQKGTKTGPYAWTWGATALVGNLGSSWADNGAITIHVLTDQHYYVCLGGSWMWNYYSPKWWETINGGVAWTEDPIGLEGQLLTSFYDAAHARVINVKGHN
jgi:hypothetical protein